jgi:phosphatidylinositol alpha-mannosyltransferase
MAHLLHVVHSFPPDSRGGIETHVAALARAQARRGDEVSVAAASARVAPGAPQVESLEGLTVLRLPVETDLLRFRAGGASTNVVHLREWIAERRPDLVHFHHFEALGPGLVRELGAAGRPTVISLHDLHTICPLHFRLREEAELCAPDVAPTTCVACLSQATGASTEQLAPTFERRSAGFAADLRAAGVCLALSQSQLDYLRRVPLLADVELRSIGFAAAPDLPGEPLPLQLPDLPLQIHTWGGLVRGKGLPLLLEAVRRLPPESVEVHHHGGQLDAGLARELSTSAAPGTLHLYGPYRPEELRARLVRCDLAVFPSLFLETYGFTTDEALDLGLPVLVPDRGAPRERLGRRGRTFRVGDAADLARELQRFVDHPEELLRLRHGEPAPRQSLEQYLRRLDEVYEALLAAH